MQGEKGKGRVRLIPSFLALVARGRTQRHPLGTLQEDEELKPWVPFRASVSPSVKSGGWATAELSPLSHQPSLDSKPIHTAS